ncbi:MAG: alpha/beta hydrolase-fold protein, partial [Candidatus Hodarchaeota archaeon]
MIFIFLVCINPSFRENNSSTAPISQITSKTTQSIPDKYIFSYSRNKTQLNFYSSSVEDNFTIYVSLPEDYNSSSSQKHPVIYLLDG